MKRFFLTGDFASLASKKLEHVRGLVPQLKHPKQLLQLFLLKHVQQHLQQVKGALYIAFTLSIVSTSLMFASGNVLASSANAKPLSLEVISSKVISRKAISREIKHAELRDGVLSIELSEGKLHITALNQESVEVFYQPPNVHQLPSFALPENHAVFKEVELITSSDKLVMRLPELDVLIDRSPLKIAFKKGDKLLLEEESGLFAYDTLRGFRFQLDDTEAMLGGGQRVLGMNRRGHRLPLYNKAHYGYSTESSQMYYSLPAVMSSKHYILAFDNSASGFLDIAHTEQNILQFEAVSGRTAYIFSAGDSASDVVSNFVSITGTQPLPPRWALGNYASRFGYRTQEETLATINKFIEQDFPVDAVVLDLFWFGPDIKGHMGNLQWDKNAFPEPEKMIATLKDKGVKTILITEPFILTSSSQWQSAVDNNALTKNLAGEPRRFDFYFGNTGLVDVFDKGAQDWFWSYYAELNKQGVAGWWGDLGEPEVHPADSLHWFNTYTDDTHSNTKAKWVTGDQIHNVYGHKWAEMVYSRQAEMRPNERPFVMMRAGFLGSQRYGMVPWTGDVERSWNGLKPQVELALQMSLFGLAYTHSDLGGFAGGEVFDPELYVRWMQYGVFQPVYRPHAQDHIAPEPVFHDESTQNLVRPFVKLRYELLPYNYSLSMENSMQGIPMMRPLFMVFEGQDIGRTDAYMWGDALLVSPVLSPGVEAQSIELPEGGWFYFFGHSPFFKGGQSISVLTPLDELPVFARAGSFIPMIDAIQNTEQYSSRLLKVRHFTHESQTKSLYTLYEDDGKTPATIENGDYQQIVFNSERKANTLLLEVKVEGKYPDAPLKRHLVFDITGLNSTPESISVAQKQVGEVFDKNALNMQTGYYWDEQNKRLYVSGELTQALSFKIVL
uniref:glycoside hydrolase family 31 protein n=1 Tax=Ningiella ruwaisensis TaxID=2364274 RepID=UPI001F4F970F|nr:TIM-barrel domain-containing protein [Ningiella ruwaisensis]